MSMRQTRRARGSGAGKPQSIRPTRAPGRGRDRGGNRVGSAPAIDADEPARSLSEGLRAMQLQASGDRQQQMLRLLEALARWNRTYNLTAVRDPAAMVTHHLLDSAAIVGSIVDIFGQRPLNVLDVGSGAGFPGLVLAIIARGPNDAARSPGDDADGSPVWRESEALVDETGAEPDSDGGPGTGSPRSGEPDAPASGEPDRRRGPDPAVEPTILRTAGSSGAVFAIRAPTAASSSAAAAGRPTAVPIASGGGRPPASRDAKLEPASVRGRPIPRWQVTLLDAVEKKVGFQRHAIALLGLDNATAVHARAEAGSSARYDAIVARAFGSLAEFVAATRHLLADGGRWLAMKGGRPDAELAGLPADVAVEAVLPLAVPGLDAERHLIVLRPVAGADAAADAGRPERAPGRDSRPPSSASHG
ncbi:MAG: 16S rRNA (guanine(527)-N(7))-methyltransferase RsmG [Burkholderiales bacterium]|nr:MAG: 16S rRNA (guanine(527)-N(7))-methyltransferase RsmG [Burkholderiales bacterium]